MSYDRTPTIDDAGTISIDVPTLLRTKLLLTASSGGGKSWGVRRILEQTFGMAQHIVLDRDGEFHTLRERFDYGLLGDGGEGAVTVESAGMAAKRLLELGVSAIVDLSSLRGPKDLWVKGFCEGLMAAPRSLWHPLMIVLDEAHRYAPEVGAGEAASTDAIKELATDGRKRAFCLIACTQRVAALHKSVVAELHNKLIGLTTMDVDVQRAARQLGMKPSRAVDELTTLKPGQFHVVGPALSKRVQLVTVGAVATTHPEPGQADMPPTPPRAKIREVLGQLKEIAPEGEKELRTVEQLRARVRELEEKISNEFSAGGAYQRDAAVFAKEAGAERTWNDVLEILLDDVTRSIDGAISEMEAMRERQAALADALLEARNLIPNRLEDEAGKHDRAGRRTASAAEVLRATAGIEAAAPVARHTNGDGIPEPMSRVERAILTVFAQRNRPILSKGKILQLAGYAASGPVSKAFAKLTREGWLAPSGRGLLAITDEGLRALGSYDPLPTGRALREHYRRSMSVAEAKIFDVLCEVYPREISKGEILKRSGYASSGPISKAFAYLVKRDLAVSTRAGHLVAAKELF